MPASTSRSGVAPPVDPAKDPLTDPAADVPAQVALTDALDLLVSRFGLRSALLRADGTGSGLLAVAGDLVYALPEMRGADGRRPRPAVELPVPSATGGVLATLVVVGSRPEQLAALRSNAVLLGLALTGIAAGARAYPTADDVRALVEDSEQEYDDLAGLLHDDAVQALVAARYLCDAAVRGGDVALARGSVQTALVTLRRALWQVRSRGGGRGELPLVLEALSAQRTETGRAALRLSVSAEAAADLGGAAGVTGYRLVQWLAAASGDEGDEPPIEVSLHRVPDGLVLDVSGGRAQLPLHRWQRRAEAIGGQLTVSPTGVRLLLPAAADSTDVVGTARTSTDRR